MVVLSTAQVAALVSLPQFMQLKLYTLKHEEKVFGELLSLVADQMFRWEVSACARTLVRERVSV